MAIYREDIVNIELTSGTIFRSFMNHAIGSGDGMANRFGVRLFRDGEPVSAESAVVRGLFMAPDGTRYTISETSYPGSTGRKENEAYVQLPSICYAVTGRFTLAIKLTGGGVEGTMRIIDGTVDETGEAGAVVPTSTIPATAEIIAAYEEAIEEIGKSVRFDVNQALEETQKAKARQNIGAADNADVDELYNEVEKRIRYDESQTLSSTERKTARDNIGAAKASEVEELRAAIEAEAERAAGAEAGKVSKPDTNPEGTNGYFLMSKGSNKTEWSPIGSPTDEQVAEAVTDWLDEHPEATTTVEDNSLDLEKFTDKLKKMTVNEGVISPIYMGDFLTNRDRLPSCCLLIDGAFICIDAPTRAKAIEDQSNDGMIRKFDLETNQELVSFQKVQPVGHANSIAYDPVNEKIYVAPIWDTSGGTEALALYLYVYNVSMENIGTVETPTTAMGVSFDHATNTLYYYDYSQRIFSYNGESWDLQTTVDFTGIVENIMYARTYNQDFAIYDGMFYISSPYGNIVYGKMGGVLSKIIGSFIVNDIDTSARFHLGELEGMEFTEDGHLYAINYAGLTTEVSNAFVVELPMGLAISHSTNIAGNLFRLHDGTFTLSETTQNEFALDTYHIRSMTQLASILLSGNTTRINIPEGNAVEDNYIIAVTQNIELYIAGAYTVKRFQVLGGELSICPYNENNLLTTTDENTVFRTARVGKVKLAGEYALRILTPNLTSKANNLVDIGFSYPITTIRVVPVSVSGIDFYIGSGKVENGGLYYGRTSVTEFNYGETLTFYNTYIFSGYVTLSARRLLFTIPLSKAIKAGSILTIDSGSVQVRGVLGYLNGSEQSAVIDLTDNSYTIIATGRGAAIQIRIEKETAFGNINNNTPVSVIPASNIVISISEPS